MKRGGKTLLCLLCLGALATTVRAVVNDSDKNASSNSDATSDSGTPYNAIWLRNVFDLKPPTPPPTVPTNAPAPPPNIKLTGITTIFGNKQALFMVQEPQTPGKPPSKEESYILKEGERQGALEVLNIDPKTSLVKIKNDGVESTITFETNKPAGGPAGQVSMPGGPPGGPPGAPPMPRGFGQRPPGAPGSMPIPIQRPVRSADNQGGYSPVTPQGGYGQPGGIQAGYGQAQGANAGLNLGNMFNQPVQSTSIPESAQPPNIPVENQIAIILAQQAANADKIRAGLMPPLPIPAGVADPLAGDGQSQSGSSGSPSLAPPVSKPKFYPPGYGPKGNYIPPGAQ